MHKILTQCVYRKALTSITATILPRHTPDQLAAMVKAGVTIFRINLSWFNKRDRNKWRTTLGAISELAQKQKLILGVMLDTKGPEFRVGRLKRGLGALQKNGDREYRKIDYEGTDITLTLHGSASCDERTIAVQAPENTEFELLGERVMFGDGNYQAIIRPDEYNRHSMIIRPEGRLSIWEGSKVNFPGTNLTAPAINRQESEAIRFFVDDVGPSLNPPMNFMFAQSFVKTANDVIKFEGLLMGDFNIKDPIIIAKMETFESALDKNLKDIIQVAAAVMIARGDLANETSRREVPRLQRKINQASKELGKPVLLATEVYNSMGQPGIFHCKRPEAEDVRSALEQGVDGFVLTGETTARPDPEVVIQALANQMEKDEQELIESGYYFALRTAIQGKFHKEFRGRVADPTMSVYERGVIGTIDFAIAAVFRANFYEAIGLFPFTSKGGTVRAMSRYYPETPIYALTPDPKTAQLALLHRCTHPILIEIAKGKLRGFGVNDLKKLVREVVDTLGLQNTSKSNYAIATMAHLPLQPGGTDTLLRIRLDSTKF